MAACLALVVFAVLEQDIAETLQTIVLLGAKLRTEHAMSMHQHRQQEKLVDQILAIPPAAIINAVRFPDIVEPLRLSVPTPGAAISTMDVATQALLRQASRP